MRVLVAGASGVIGGPLIRQLVAAGHEVSGTTSAPARSGAIEAAGARPAICDALDAAAVAETVAAARPEAVVNELTRLPREYNPRALDYEPTNRVRREGGRNLLEAVRSAGARRFLTQSIAFLYVPEGPSVVEEDARPWTDAPGGLSDAIATLIAHERPALEADGRILGGSITAQTANGLRGASNAKAKRELGWTPRYPSWRQGFREALQVPANSTQPALDGRGRPRVGSSSQANTGKRIQGKELLSAEQGRSPAGQPARRVG